MMTSTAQSPSEFLRTGQHSTPSSTQAAIAYVEFEKPVVSIAGTRTLASVIGRLEADPEFADLMVEARRTIPAELYGANDVSLPSIRLRAGLSQARLATLAGTSQPYINRIERGLVDPGTEVIAKIARALEIDEAIVFRAIRSLRIPDEA